MFHWTFDSSVRWYSHSNLFGIDRKYHHLNCNHEIVKQENNSQEGITWNQQMAGLSPSYQNHLYLLCHIQLDLALRNSNIFQQGNGTAVLILCYKHTTRLLHLLRLLCLQWQSYLILETFVWLKKRTAGWNWSQKNQYKTKQSSRQWNIKWMSKSQKQLS